MSLSSFKIAHKLITGAAAIEQLSAELARLDIDNPLIVTDAALVKSGTVELALAQLGDRAFEIFDRVLPDPEIAIVEDCMRVYRDGGHDGLIGLGGGSAIDIAKSVAKTNRLLVIDEDVPGGASAYILQQVVDVQGAYKYLDSKPETMAAKEHRPAYGTDGDYFSKPSVEDIFEKVYGIMHEAKPNEFPELY